MTINAPECIENVFEFHNLEAVFEMNSTELFWWLNCAATKMHKDLVRTREELGWPAYYTKAKLWRRAIEFAQKETKPLSPMCYLLAG